MKLPAILWVAIFSYLGMETWIRLGPQPVKPRAEIMSFVKNGERLCWVNEDGAAFGPQPELCNYALGLSGWSWAPCSDFPARLRRRDGGN